MTDLDLKWSQIGKIVAIRLIDEKGVDNLRDKFEALNEGPKDTHIEIQNYCVEKGITELMKDEMHNDSRIASPDFKWNMWDNDMEVWKAINELEDNAYYRLRGEFSGACANELIKKMYE